MEPRATRVLILMVLLGTAGRLVLAFETYGNEVDILNSRWAIDTLRDGTPLDFYADMDGEPRWPYLVGFVPWLFVAAELDERLGHFDAWLQVAPIVADALIAVVVFVALKAAGASTTVRLWAVALVTFGPAFVMISGHAFQLDPVAALPALVALVLWERNVARRALVCGLLAGIAIAVKPPLAIAVLAMLPTTRDMGEAARMIAAAAVLPALLLAPFLIAEPAATVTTFQDYAGLAGQAGLTALLQPSLLEIWLQTGDFDRYDPLFGGIGALLNGAVLVGGTAFAVRCRLRALDAASLLALLLWAFGSGMSFAYLLWGLPFLLAAGRIVVAAVIEALATLPLLLLATSPTSDTGVLIYRIDVVVLYAVFLAAIVYLAREAMAARSAPG